MRWRVWLYRVVPYLGRRQAEADLEEELRLHLELERERQRDAGFAGDVADRAAQRKLGNGALIRERTRDVWGWLWLDDLGRDLASVESSAGFYIPLGQSEASPFPFVNTPFISVRTIGNPLAVVPFLREAVADVHPGAALDDVTTMETRLSSSVAQPRFQAVFVASFGAVALLLAMLGVYGLLSHTVAQRRGEIGIRMALGARTGHVLALVVRQGALLLATGVGLGLLAAAASSRVLESFLFGVATDDRLTFIAAPLVLMAVALVACWLPARRATRIDPLEALRFE